MSIKSTLGLESATKIRYAIVALGDISQASLMPGVAHTGNSVITALVTSDPVKSSEVARQYSIAADSVYGYEQFDALLQSGKIDAIYLATPNWRHAEFAGPALRAGVHVLLEKPMEITVPLCQQIIDAQQSSGTKLMIAYRLHFEPATLAIIDLLRAGELGQIRSFSSVFSQRVKTNNHRALNGTNAGPLYDMGPYPINAVRNLFEAEPIEVFGFGTRSADAGLPMDFDHTVTAVLKFPGERIAQFTVSYVGDTIDEFTVLGTDGFLTQTPAYGFGKPHEYTLSRKGTPTKQSFKNTDHFGGELQYFSNAIRNDTDIEPDGEEGLLDVRVIEAIVQSLESGKAVKLPPMNRSKRIQTQSQIEKLRAVSPPKNEINAENPGQK